MIFHEIHNAYWRILARLLTAATEKAVTEDELYALIREDGFAETSLVIPEKLKGEWPLLDGGKNILRHVPPLPVTDPERAFLKAALADPRFTIFLEEDAARVLSDALSDTPPLWTAHDIVYYDRHVDGDPFTDETYRGNFRVMLSALRDKKQVHLTYRSRGKEDLSYTATVLSVEYSGKDDAFRFDALHGDFVSTLNAAGLLSVSQTDIPAEDAARPEKKRSVVLEIEDKRNSLSRAMLHFSDLQKETKAAAPGRWHMTLWYERDDEMEILIRILSFGPFLKILVPETMRKKLAERLQKQISFMQKDTPSFISEKGQDT